MKNFISFYLICISAISTIAQKNIEIIKDDKIDILIKEQSNITPPATVPQITGYRIQLFFDSDKKMVDNARLKFISIFPKVETYIIYNAPNYLLKVGNFRTHLEAEKIKTSIDRDFPTNYIIKELINLPRID